LRYRQNISGRKIAVVFLGRQQWPQLKPHVQRVVDAINSAVVDSYLEIDIPS
jgi:hypothetical protein